MPPQNYGGQQPLMPGQQPMPNLNQGNLYSKFKTKLLSFVNIRPCLAVCVDMME